MLPTYMYQVRKSSKQIKVTIKYTKLVLVIKTVLIIRRRRRRRIR